MVARRWKLQVQVERQPLLGSKAVIFGANFTDPPIYKNEEIIWNSISISPSPVILIDHLLPVLHPIQIQAQNIQ